MDTTDRDQFDTPSGVDHPDLHRADRASRRRDRASRRGMTGVVLAVALAAGVAPAAHTGAAAAPLGGCLVTPSANSMGFDASALVTTVRVVDGTMEMLHDADCADGRAGTVWIASDIIPSRQPALLQHTEPLVPRARSGAAAPSDPPMLTAADGLSPAPRT